MEIGRGSAKTRGALVMLSRRGFAKWLATMAGALLMPKGNKMTFDSLPYMRGQLGDLLAIDNPSPGDRQRIRLEMNNLQKQVSTLSVLMDSTGNLDPNIFLKHSRGFSILPLEMASLRFDTQAIGDSSATTPTTLDPSAATWNYGMEIDITNSRIKITGLAKESIYLFCAWWQWAANDTGYRYLEWRTDDGGGVKDTRDAPAYAIYNSIVHVRRQAAADAYYEVKVWQDSGGNLNGDGLFTAVRLR